MTVKQRWFLIAAMWIALFFGAFAFYWIMVRPVSVRRMCAEKAMKVSMDAKSGTADMLEINRAVYLECLKCNGVKQ